MSRPRRGDLVPALIARQDATARLTARSLAVLSRAHVAADDVGATWRTECERAATLCAPLAARAMVATVVKAAVDGPAAVETLLAGAVRRILASLGACPARADAESSALPRLRPSTELDAARARTARLRAEWLTIKEQIQAGALVSTAVVERTWAARILAARALLLSLPVTLADRLHRAATLGDTAAITTALKGAVRDVLRELEPR